MYESMEHNNNKIDLPGYIRVLRLKSLQSKSHRSRIRHQRWCAFFLMPGPSRWNTENRDLLGPDFKGE
jgi:hypothetical protein